MYPPKTVTDPRPRYLPSVSASSLQADYLRISFVTIVTNDVNGNGNDVMIKRIGAHRCSLVYISLGRWAHFMT
jgi:hypothetical protein